MEGTIKRENFWVDADKKGCLVTCVIKAFPPVIEIAIQKAYDVIRKQVQVAGFRKGKVPKSVIQKLHRELFIDEINDRLIRLIVNEIFENKLLPNPVNTIQLIKSDSDFFDACKSTLTIEYDTMPAIPEIDFSQIDFVNIEPEDISEAVIEQKMRQLLIHHAVTEKSLKDVDRPIEETDLVVVDIERVESKKELFDLKSEEDTITEQFLKKELGASFDLKIAEESFPIKILNIYPFHKTIDQITKEMLPATFKSTEELREFVIQDCKKFESKKLIYANKDRVRDFLLSIDIDRPEKLIEEEALKRIRQEIDTNYKQQFASLDGSAKEDFFKKLLTKIKDLVAIDYKLKFITATLCERFEIKATASEIHEVLFGLNPDVISNPDMPQDSLQRLVDNASSIATTDKLLKYIIEKYGRSAKEESKESL